MTAADDPEAQSRTTASRKSSRQATPDAVGRPRKADPKPAKEAESPSSRQHQREPEEAARPTPSESNGRNLWDAVVQVLRDNGATNNLVRILIVTGALLVMLGVVALAVMSHVHLPLEIRIHGIAIQRTSYLLISGGLGCVLVGGSRLLRRTRRRSSRR